MVEKIMTMEYLYKIFISYLQSSQEETVPSSVDPPPTP